MSRVATHEKRTPDGQLICRSHIFQYPNQIFYSPSPEYPVRLRRTAGSFILNVIRQAELYGLAGEFMSRKVRNFKKCG